MSNFVESCRILSKLSKTAGKFSAIVRKLEKGGNIMETEKDGLEMLDLLVDPAFCVRDGLIVKANIAALAYSLCPGTEVFPLLLTGEAEYRGFAGGCLSLQLHLEGQTRSASVTKLGDVHVFLLDSEEEDDTLRAMALAARELRQPLSNLIAIADTLLPRSSSHWDEKTRQQMARLSRGLYQLEKTVGNMSDAGGAEVLFHPEYRDIPSIFDEIFQKAAALLSTSGAALRYTGMNQSIYGLIDAQMMERAVLNILSNALKFQPTGCEIQAALTRQGSFLRLSLQDNGPGIDSGILGSLFSRHLRQPGLEDSRYGIGLGMTIIRSAAMSHGGTVLVDQPESGGTRVTMTMKLRKPTETTVRTPGILLSSGRDMALIELSQCLPLSVYEKDL